MDIFYKNTQVSNFMKIRPVGAELYHVGGQHTLGAANSRFSRCANAPKNKLLSYVAIRTDVIISYTSITICPTTTTYFKISYIKVAVGASKTRSCAMFVNFSV